MADILPFKAFRYNHILGKNLKELTAPLTETILQQKHEIFYQKPFHYYHISSPIDTPPFQNAQRRVENWKLDKVINQDTLPAIYVYYHYFHLKDSDKTYCRKGFIAFIKACEYKEKVILPHELTIQKAVEYREALLENMLMHTIPTHGFYTDEAQSVEKYLEEAIAVPLYEITDNDGVIHKLGRIHDKKVINQFILALKDKQVWIADGHHRYESSVHFRKHKMRYQKEENPKSAFNYHMMWLTNTKSSDLGVFPTHRIVHSLENFDKKDFLQRLSIYFDIKEIEKSKEMGLAPTENLWTFLLIFQDKNYQIQLKKEAFESFEAEQPKEVKELDVSVMHYFILEKSLGLKEQMLFDYLDFSQYLSKCYAMVNSGEAQFAILTRKITLEEIEKVCLSGDTMPAKATYFYPKVLGGLVFGSMHDNEFEYFS